MGGFQDQETGMRVGELQDPFDCPWDDEVVLPRDPFMISDPLCQQEQCSTFESWLDSLPTISTLEEHEAALAGQVIAGGMPSNPIEAVQNENVQTFISEVTPQSTMSSPLESYADCSNEPVAKRPRNFSYYTTEDVVKKLPRGSNLGQGSLRSNEDLQKDMSPVATDILSHLNVSSPRCSVPFVSSLPNVNSTDKKQEQYQSYRYPTRRLSVDPESVAARERRRKIQEKIRCLEKLIPLQSKLDTATMLEVAGKYVKFLQAQLQVLESMPSSSFYGFGSARTLNPPTKDTMRLPSSSSALGKGVGGSRNFKVDLVPISLEQRRSGENLSFQQMLNVLLTSRAIQRKIFREEKCVANLQQYQLLATEKGSNNLDFLFH